MGKIGGYYLSAKQITRTVINEKMLRARSVVKWKN